jgi:outer membrane protein insertion porin family
MRESVSSPIKTSQNASRIFRRTLKPLAFVLLCFTVFSAWAQQQTITQIRVIGNRRIPKETIVARLFSHEGEPFDPTTVERDFNSLWNTGYFEDVRIEREDNPKGGIILDIYVREKATIREINYKGLNSVTQSDVLDRLKKEKVGFSVESQYDPTRIAKVETVIKELLAEHGHQFATIKADVKTIPPASVQVNFLIKEGPKVKVGNISFTGNQHVSSRELRAAMRNLRPIGIPHSIILRRQQARRRCRTRAPRLSGSRLLPRLHRRAADASPQRRRPLVLHLPPAQGQAHRHPHSRRRRRTLSSRQHHLPEQQDS